MSQLLINTYLRQLDVLRKTSGNTSETIVREAFKDLLKNWGKQHDLIFVAEYPLKTTNKTTIRVDGVLLHELRLPMGYWEAKDINDDLDKEIAKKFRKGYPQDNIIFTDDVTAVLWQNRQELLRCDMTDTKALEKLLKVFFSFERPEITGFRTAVEQFKQDLPSVLDALRQMIAAAHDTNPHFQQAENKFLLHAQEAINPCLTGADVREMLIQHILTEAIFSKVFGDSDFHRHNNVARELYALEDVFFIGALKKQTLKGLEPYYAAIYATAAQISSHHEKQTFLKVIYENFYKVYNTKAADRLGVVYTPNEIVRFMIDGADWLCEKHFGKNLIDKGVDILDPATGTGTYICELLEHFRGQPKKLEYKYQNELHANEVAILPYYVANLNIEATYAAITGQYVEFPSLCFVDTLDNVGEHTQAKNTTNDMFGSMSKENVFRIQRQNSKHISIVIGNPPYNANQANENDNNKNREYPIIDTRIKQSYIAESTAQKTKLYDMYTRFFRWASDHLNDDGIIAFVTNRSFIESRTFDGFRKTIMEEFSDIYVVDLGGDVRANPKLSGTKHNVFGIQTGVAISFFVKKNTDTKNKRLPRVHYVRRPEMETSEEKLSFLVHNKMGDLDFDIIKPDAKNNWLNQTDTDFNIHIPLASKETKAAKTAGNVKAIFHQFSLGVVTARDEWVYGFNSKEVARKVHFLIKEYNSERLRLKGDLRRREGLENRLNYKIKWTRAVKNDLSKSVVYRYQKESMVQSNYRPFVKKSLYFSKQLNEMQYLLRHIFGIHQGSRCIAISGIPAAKSFQTLAIDSVPCYDMLEKTQTLPLHHYENGQRIDNITDWALEQFNAHYGVNTITKEAIFHYCYAVLHCPAYREKYALNLKQEFPRIPFYADFSQWEKWGEELMRLHIDYENIESFALQRVDVPDEKARLAGLNPKVLLRSDSTAGTITLDSETTLQGIPPEAWAYQLGNRSALDWIIDQYKEKTPKDPTIREHFNTYRFVDSKEQVIDLLQRVTTVSVRTVGICDAMRGAVGVNRG
jgi:predicted helicase